MQDFNTRHDPPQVLTVVAITCRNCLGKQSFVDAGRDSLCHLCENGYEKVLVDAARLHEALRVFAHDAARLHEAVVAMAGERAVRLPVLTHSTANLPVYLHPTKRRIPLSQQSCADGK